MATLRVPRNPLNTPATPTPLPDLTHLGAAEFERVYEPSDDTYLLVDALAADAERLRSLLDAYGEARASSLETPRAPRRSLTGTRGSSAVRRRTRPRR